MNNSIFNWLLTLDSGFNSNSLVNQSINPSVKNKIEYVRISAMIAYSNSLLPNCCLVFPIVAYVCLKPLGSFCVHLYPMHIGCVAGTLQTWTGFRNGLKYVIAVVWNTRRNVCFVYGRIDWLIDHWIRVGTQIDRHTSIWNLAFLKHIEYVFGKSVGNRTIRKHIMYFVENQTTTECFVDT